jgi:hypothetical protein
MSMNPSVTPDETVRQRFMAKVLHDSTTGCWLWTGRLNDGGYGQFKLGQAPRLAHRVALLLFRGVPLGGDRKDSQADHLCRVRRCVNPDHLEMVSSLTNNLRKLAARPRAERTHCPKGHALTPENTNWHRNYPHCRVCHRASQALINARVSAQRVARAAQGAAQEGAVA